MASTYTSLKVHVIFATRNREPLIESAWMEEMHRYIAGTAKGLGGHPLAIGGVEDHVHMFVGLKAMHCVADFVREVKKASSAWGAEHDPKFGWQAGYAAFSVGAEQVPTVITYIEGQEEHHKMISSAEELRRILRDEGIEWEEKYFE